MLTWGPYNTLELPDALVELADIFPANLFLVGGSVRDLFLTKYTGASKGDLDLASELPYHKVADWCDENNLTFFGISEDHGTIGFIFRGLKFEHTTFRKDVSTDGRRATISNGTLEQDLLRRDSTINAAALEIKTKKVFADKNFMNDIDNRVIRSVGNPFVRRKEDYLRIIRDYRFAARYNFKIESWTKLADWFYARELRSLSKERITDEVRKSFPHTERFFEMLHEDKIDQYVFPIDLGTLIGLNCESEYTMWASLCRGADWKLRMYFILPNAVYEAIDDLYDRASKEVLVHVAKSPYQLRRVMNSLKRMTILGCCDYHDVDLDLYLFNKANSDPLITGDDLIYLGLTPGPQFKTILDECLHLQLDFDFHRNDLLYYIGNKYLLQSLK